MITEINPANRKAIQLLDKWMQEPDHLGEEWWNEFEATYIKKVKFGK